MGTSLNRRANDIFLSHSSRDKLDFVDGLYQWLTKKAGLRVRYDPGLCIIDITNLTYPDLPPKIDFALNSCIEAGVASHAMLAADTHPASPPRINGLRQGGSSEALVPNSPAADYSAAAISGGASI